MKNSLRSGLAIAMIVACSSLAVAAPGDESSTSQPVKAKHDGGINDLDAIGNRNGRLRPGS